MLAATDVAVWYDIKFFGRLDNRWQEQLVISGKAMSAKTRDVGDIVKCIECDAYVPDRAQFTQIGERGRIEAFFR